ncbi:MAG: phosphoribosylglycinamide formyltransferase [Sedimentisphaerales bacterium]|nr:phosphoribosylglycinamide formyltransferase [Sedimentisphaerales bacterium]
MLAETERLTIYTDGASRGNPGPAAAAFVITDKNKNPIAAKGIYLGQATNNVAEYTGLIRALNCAKEKGAKQLRIYSDSELMVRQINGQYKVKSELIRPLFQQVAEALDEFESWKIEHITRDKNTKADSLCNRALDLQRDVEKEDKPEKSQKHLRLGILLSGGGRTMLNILEYIERGGLNAEIPIVISSRSTVKGVERAQNAGLNVEIIRKKDYPDINDFSKQIEKVLTAANVDLIIQAGWLCLWKIPQKYENRVINIHPALLPSFGGQGMWGHHVHEAVLKAGCKVSGCTVHFCTNEYDKGAIVVQRCCPVEETDDADTLAARVFEQECIAYPEAIKLFAQGRIKVQNNRTIILPE